MLCCIAMISEGFRDGSAASSAPAAELASSTTDSAVRRTSRNCSIPGRSLARTACSSCWSESRGEPLPCRVRHVMNAAPAMTSAPPVSSARWMRDMADCSLEQNIMLSLPRRCVVFTRAAGIAGVVVLLSACGGPATSPLVLWWDTDEFWRPIGGIRTGMPLDSLEQFWIEHDGLRESAKVWDRCVPVDAGAKRCARETARPPGRGDHVESAGRPCSLPRATLRAGVHGNAPVPDLRALPQPVMLNPELFQAVERHAGPDTTDWPIEFVRIPPQHEGGRGGTATRGEQYDDPGDAGRTGEHDAPPGQGKHNLLFQGAIGHVSHPYRAAHRGRARHRGRSVHQIGRASC